MASFRSLILAAAVPVCGGEPPAPPDDLLGKLLEASSRDEVAFRDVVKRVTGHQVLPIDPSAPEDQALIEVITGSMNRTLALLNRADSPLRRERRINEASRYFEQSLKQMISEHPDFECAVPWNGDGAKQAAGYPDLRILHVPSGRVSYLDPKLTEAGSLDGTLRTFYFTPRTGTNKIREDARHLLVGISHDGKDGAWTFLSWKLVDLHDFRVRLKAEFQAGNRDLYRPELIIRSGP